MAGRWIPQAGNWKVGVVTAGGRFTFAPEGRLELQCPCERCQEQITFSGSQPLFRRLVINTVTNSLVEYYLILYRNVYAHCQQSVFVILSFAEKNSKHTFGSLAVGMAKTTTTVHRCPVEKGRGGHLFCFFSFKFPKGSTLSTVYTAFLVK